MIIKRFLKHTLINNNPKRGVKTPLYNTKKIRIMINLNKKYNDSDNICGICGGDASICDGC